MQLVRRDRARLRLACSVARPHLLVLEVDRAARALQLLALQEEADTSHRNASGANAPSRKPPTDGGPSSTKCWKPTTSTM
jgi:hypothetical protein